VLALGALALFTAVNWSAFTTPTTLPSSFTVEAPLVLPGTLVLLAALFLAWLSVIFGVLTKLTSRAVPARTC
jgi:hypothetical protein